MVLNQTHLERIVKNLGSVKQVRGKCELSPLVSLLNFSFRITMAGQYNKPVLVFLPLSFVVTSIPPLLFGFLSSWGGSKVTNSLAFFANSEFFHFCYYQNLVGFGEKIGFARCPSAEENFGNLK